MSIRLLFGLLLISSIGFSQTNFESIDARSKRVPNQVRSVQAIADYLTGDLDSEVEKARAIYVWIAHNIRYDLNQVGRVLPGGSNFDLVEEALKKKKGICQHYAELFQELSHAAGLTSFLMVGYTLGDDGSISSLSHAWNAVEIDEQFYFMDVTWASGYEQNGRYIHEFRDEYFMQTPERFIQHHMPFDPMWQFRDYPLSHEEFARGNHTDLENKALFSYRDTIANHFNKEEWQQLVDEKRRCMEQYTVHREIRKVSEKHLLNLNTMIFNLAIDTLNFAVNNYNAYIYSKNNTFKNPRIEDAQIERWVMNTKAGLEMADLILTGLESSDAQLNKMIEATRKKIPGFYDDIKREENFLHQYLNASKLKRKLLF